MLIQSKCCIANISIAYLILKISSVKKIKEETIALNHWVKYWQEDEEKGPDSSFQCKNKFWLFIHITAFMHSNSKHVQLVISAAATSIKNYFNHDKDQT